MNTDKFNINTGNFYGFTYIKVLKIYSKKRAFLSFKTKLTNSVR